MGETAMPFGNCRSSISRCLLLVVEGRKGFGFLEGRPVVVINPEVERVVRHHPQHHPVAEDASLAEHRRIVTRPSGASSSRRNSAKVPLETILNPLALARRSQLLQAFITL